MKYRDFEEFLASLNDRGARYLVVGASKKSADRAQDRADVEVLLRAKRADDDG